MVKNFVKTVGQFVLKRLGLYERIKTSFLYDFYWGAADPSLLQKREDEIRFFRETLVGFRERDLVFDVGANHGYKSDMFLRLGARVVAIDPDVANQEILRRRFLAYRLRKKAITVIGMALSDHAGVETMWVHEPGSAKNTLNRKWVETLGSDQARFGGALQFQEEAKVATTTLEQLILTFGRPFYVKIDVEGYEPTVLRGLHTAVPYLSFEVNLPEFRKEGFECIELLHGIDASGQFNYSEDNQKGMELKDWLSYANFGPILEGMTGPSVEIFWRTVDR